MNTGVCTECPDGFFGPVCGDRCPSNCGSAGCEISDGNCKEQVTTSGNASADQNGTDTITTCPVSVPILSSAVGLLVIILAVGIFYHVKLRKKQTIRTGDVNDQDNAYSDLNTMELQPPNIYEQL
ncbi:uncharacterized protein LOC117324925 [Pecten maximus]|uniref:uncharacterized protein LOC117324925 n=1 Tax=Pecten maximus TaxID=6579 RepID=UPI0014588DD2|nr:uncharacterized protein LOC117324925 [Pecten maximus]XP_033736658.1 uncharacterized protein LOC117324925 [Pecten maximus]